MIIKKLLLILIMGTGAAMLCGAAPLFQPISFSSNETKGVDEIRAQFFVNADPQTAWTVLTDFEHIPQFVSSMKKSHIEEVKDGDIYLCQEAEAGFLFITKRVHVLLRVHEVPGQSISFQDVSRKDFYFYQGSWNIDPGPQGGVTVTYQLEAQKNFDAPFAGDYLHGGVKDLITAVQKEIYQQQAKIDKANSVTVIAGQNGINSAMTPGVSRPVIN
jgi:ribosome-associated toxin RatA of RatAB toxin-antitoxin module